MTLQAIRRDFTAATTEEVATWATITRTFKAADYLLDPHPAVGLHVAQQ